MKKINGHWGISWKFFDPLKMSHKEGKENQASNIIEGFLEMRVPYIFELSSFSGVQVL